MNEWSSILDPLSPFRPRDLPITHITMWPQGTPAVADLEAHRAALCLEVVQLEDRLAVAHRRLARQQATIRRLRRHGPRWTETVSAFMADRLDRLSAWTLGWYL